MMITKVINRSFATAGSLFTWGETTYGWGRKVNVYLRTPGKIQGFNDIVGVCAGPYHLIFARANKQVYSVGLGSNGRLGHGNIQSLDEPKSIDRLNNVGVRKIAAGNRHSLALTESGDVFAWGYGGRTGGVFKYLSLFRTDSPTGFGDLGDIFSPQLIESLKERATAIAAGTDFSIAIGESGKVYGWGSGLADLGEAPTSAPIQLPQINYFLHSHHAHVQKVKSSGANAFFLLDDGRLYVTGKNNGGLFATRRNSRIMDDNRAYGLTRIIDEDLKGEKIVRFKISSNSLIFQTDSGAVFYSGMHNKFRPERFPIKAGAVKKIFATQNSVGVVDKQGRVEYLNDEFITDSDKKGDVFIARDQNLKNPIKIGGPNKLRYAIIGN